jgi:glycosyltransferase involved in cell wall biosynthesis
MKEFASVSITRPTAEAITIAITVYNRTDYICQAISSALAQTVPVRVIVVEDCAPTDAVRELVTREFGDRVRYFRNPARRGLFDNWNACLEYADTPWISILHDDDFLHPDFVSSMLTLADAAPPVAIYFSRPDILEEGSGRGPQPAPSYDFPAPWRLLDVEHFARTNLVLFPGQLIHIPAARAVGGFRGTSLFAGDWEMWFKLAFHFGAAQTRAAGAVCRSHSGATRETNRIFRSGRKRPLDIVQARRNFALLKTRQSEARIERKKLLQESPESIRELLQRIRGFPPRIARYHLGLLLSSPAPNFSYALFRLCALLGRVPFLRVAGWLSASLRRG